MKKIILGLALSSFLFFNCSKENILLSSEGDTITSTDYSASNIKIDSLKYAPTIISVLDQDTHLSDGTTIDITRKKRTFFITKNKVESFSIQFNFSASQDKIDDTYPTNTSISNHALLTYYENPAVSFSPISGAVKVSDLEGGEYKIEFNDVVVYNDNFTLGTTTTDTDNNTTTNTGNSTTTGIPTTTTSITPFVAGLGSLDVNNPTEVTDYVNSNNNLTEQSDIELAANILSNADNPTQLITLFSDAVAASTTTTVVTTDPVTTDPDTTTDNTPSAFITGLAGLDPSNLTEITNYIAANPPTELSDMLIANEILANISDSSKVASIIAEATGNTTVDPEPGTPTSIPVYDPKFILSNSELTEVISTIAKPQVTPTDSLAYQEAIIKIYKDPSRKIISGSFQATFETK